MVSLSNDGRKSGRSREIRLRPPPPSFPDLTTTLGADYSPHNIRLLLMKPLSYLVTWDHPINRNYIEVFPYLSYYEIT